MKKRSRLLLSARNKPPDFITLSLAARSISNPIQNQNNKTISHLLDKRTDPGPEDGVADCPNLPIKLVHGRFTIILPLILNNMPPFNPSK